MATFRRARIERRPVDVWLVCSSGGHLLQLLALADAWQDRSHLWVSNDRSDARSLLAGEEAQFLPGPSSRSVPAFFRNLYSAIRLARRRRPRILVTTGADIAVPFALVAWAVRAKVVYIESFTRIERPSLSCRLIAPVADRIYAQWPELVAAVPRARFIGAVVETE